MNQGDATQLEGAATLVERAEGLAGPLPWLMNRVVLPGDGGAAIGF